MQDTRHSIDTRNPISKAEVSETLAKRNTKWIPRAISKKIEFSERIHGIFSNSWGKTNDELLTQYDEEVARIESTFTQKEKREYSRLLELQKKEILLRNEWESLDSQFFSEPDEEFNTDNEDAHELGGERLDKIEHQLYEIEQEIEHILLQNWKIDFLVHLKNSKDHFDYQIENIVRFKTASKRITSRDGNSTLWEKELRLLFPNENHFQLVISPRVKKIYSNFWVFFVVPEDMWSEKSLGYHLTGTPFSFIRDKTERWEKTVRETILHEWRHNLFPILVKAREDSFKKKLRAIKGNMARIAKLIQNNSHALIIETEFNQLDHKISHLADGQIDWLQDEVLANFDWLLKWIPSSETNIGTSLYEEIWAIESIFEPYKEIPEIYNKKNLIVPRFRMKLILFFDALSRIFFIIGKKPELLEEVRMLFYLHGTKWISHINEYLRIKIGSEQHALLRNQYAIESPKNFFERALEGKSGKSVSNHKNWLLEAYLIGLIKGKK